ncbi:DUF6463 family protein [Rhodococcus sp. NPDC058521]|uniref:DUF6463 family protein n=1 Tax=Rhodococcus sp. NPDC058521 TaxID=3346536 RepID=UPI0036627D3A
MSNGKMSTSRVTEVGGWLAIAFGAVHTVVAPLGHGSALSDAAEEGWWNTFTLDDSTTLAEALRSEAFWMTIGSFGIPMFALGSFILWSARQSHRVPAWLGWILVVWSVILTTALPASPGWVVIVIGVLLILGDRAGTRDRVQGEARRAT